MAPHSRSPAAAAVRKEQLIELRAYQRENLDKWVDQIARQREQYLNGPRHDPPGFPQLPLGFLQDCSKACCLVYAPLYTARIVPSI